MEMKYIHSLFILLGVCSPALSQTQLVVRGFEPGNTVQVEYADNALGLPSGIGLDSRTSDHATVAMNDDLDILVAFNSDRNDIPAVQGLKQIEVAFYEYQSPDTWLWRETKLVGSIDYDPLNLENGVPGFAVGCDRPDIIAVKDKFFVSWIRSYREGTSGITGADNDPAILECAWIELVQGTSNMEMKVTAAPAPGGGGTPPFAKGWELDIHSTGSNFFVKECEGVPDAVYLNDSMEPYKVAVVYAHQKEFFDVPVGSTARSCDLRMITCSFDPVFGTITSDPIPTVLKTSVPFNGENSSIGFILPDTAPSDEDNAFWLTFESQIEQGGSIEGIVGVGYIQRQGGIWGPQAIQSFRSPSGSNFTRRRPMISSYPENTSLQEAALTYGVLDPDANPVLGEDESANVDLKSLTYENGIMSLVSSGIGWPNIPNFNDGKSVVVTGRSSAGIQYCFADEAGVSNYPVIVDCKLQAWNQVTGVMGTLVSFAPPGPLGRPGVAYTYDPGAAALGLNPDYLAVTWEQITQGTGNPERVFLGVLE